MYRRFWNILLVLFLFSAFALTVSAEGETAPNPVPQESYTGLVRSDDGEYYYYIDGVLAADYTGLIAHNQILWYVDGGQVQFDYDGLVEFEGTKYLIKSGQINTNFTGITKQQGVYYYFTDGINDLGFEGLVTCNGMKAYVQNGEVNFNKTGIVEDGGSLLYVKYGIWRNTFKGLARSDDGNWLCMVGGTFYPAYNGVAKLNTNWVYVQNGYVNFKYTGTVEVSGVTYNVRHGIVLFSQDTSPQIIQQPVNASAPLGEYASVSVSATGTGLKYQWCYKDTGDTHFQKSSCTAETYTVEMSLQTHDRQVYCEVSDTFGTLILTDTVTLSVCANEDAQSLQIQIFGDSASSETYNDHHTWASNLQAVLPEYDLTVINSAIGGNTLVHWHNPYAIDNGDGTYSALDKGVAWQVGFTQPQTGVPETSGYDQYAPLDPDNDLVIIWAGSNEWSSGSRNGVIGDRSQLTLQKTQLEVTQLPGTYLAYTGYGYKLYPISKDAYSTDAYAVKAGETYLISGSGVRLQMALPLGIFTAESDLAAGTTSGRLIVADDRSVTLENAANTASNYSFTFTAPADGYILIAKCSNHPSLTVASTDGPDPTCIYGALRVTVETVREKCPNAKILVLTPMQRYDAQTPARDVDPVTGNEVNINGDQLVDVVDAIVETCDYYGIACLDMYRDSGFDRDNFQPGGMYTSDGLHPNGTADLLISQLVAEEIYALLEN